MANGRIYLPQVLLSVYRERANTELFEIVLYYDRLPKFYVLTY